MFAATATVHGGLDQEYRSLCRGSGYPHTDIATKGIKSLRGPKGYPCLLNLTRLRLGEGRTLEVNDNFQLTSHENSYCTI